MTGAMGADVDFAVIGAGLAGLASQAGGASAAVSEARDRARRRA
jgi:hypothetical protein